jgi:hypothetical protein
MTRHDEIRVGPEAGELWKLVVEMVELRVGGTWTAIPIAPGHCSHAKHSERLLRYEHAVRLESRQFPGSIFKLMFSPDRSGYLGESYVGYEVCGEGFRRVVRYLFDEPNELDWSGWSYPHFHEVTDRLEFEPETSWLDVPINQQKGVIFRESFLSTSTARRDGASLADRVGRNETAVSPTLGSMPASAKVAEWMSYVIQRILRFITIVNCDALSRERWDIPKFYPKVEKHGHEELIALSDESRYFHSRILSCSGFWASFKRHFGFDETGSLIDGRGAPVDFHSPDGFDHPVCLWSFSVGYGQWFPVYAAHREYNCDVFFAAIIASGRNRLSLVGYYADDKFTHDDVTELLGSALDSGEFSPMHDERALKQLARLAKEALKLFPNQFVEKNEY